MSWPYAPYIGTGLNEQQQQQQQHPAHPVPMPQLAQMLPPGAMPPPAQAQYMMGPGMYGMPMAAPPGFTGTRTCAQFIACIARPPASLPLSHRPVAPPLAQ